MSTKTGTAIDQAAMQKRYKELLRRYAISTVIIAVIVGTFVGMLSGTFSGLAGLLGVGSFTFLFVLIARTMWTFRKEFPEQWYKLDVSNNQHDYLRQEINKPSGMSDPSDPMSYSPGGLYYSPPPHPPEYRDDY